MRVGQGSGAVLVTIKARRAPVCSNPGGGVAVRFSELVRLLEQNGFALVREKVSIRYYAKRGIPRLIRVDYHGTKEVPTGTCNAILKAAGLKPSKESGK